MKRLFFILTLFFAISFFLACTKSSGDTAVIKGNVLTATGTLQLAGISAYQYGNYILFLDQSNQFLLEDTSANLDTYIGKQVTITAINTYYQVANGPDLYNVTSIKLGH